MGNIFPNIREVCKVLAEKFGAEMAVEIVLDSENPEWVRRFAETVQDIAPELKTKLAEFIIKNGKPHQAHYFLSLTRDIPKETQDKLIEKMGIIDKETWEQLRKPVI